ncbi:hypothetical protein evm_005363 [Chilo suppressalis]|nr:hypothetical protein evm_005363 [Chilo suppressalis]
MINHARCAELCKKKKNELCQEHIERATKLWLQRVQEDSFPQMVEGTKTGLTVPKSSPQHQVNIVMEDGLLKINGRGNHEDVPSAVKRPVILSGRHELAQLIVVRAHQHETSRDRYTTTILRDETTTDSEGDGLSNVSPAKSQATEPPDRRPA